VSELPAGDEKRFVSNISGIGLHVSASLHAFDDANRKIALGIFGYTRLKRILINLRFPRDPPRLTLKIRKAD
jgi:hypothetical protein